MELTLEALGLSQELVAERVVDQVARGLLYDLGETDEDGNPVERRSKFQDTLRARVQQQIDASVAEVAAKHVLPNISIFLETFMLQETNSWGEKKGNPVTFIEYLIQRADFYMREQVDSEGKSKSENNWGSWNGKQTRVTYLVHKHLQYSIETAMKQALADANSAIVGGLEQAIKLKLAEVQNSIKVGVQVGR